MNANTVERLKKHYGLRSSWAVWNADDITDTSVIDKYRDELHNDVVIVGLNVSAAIKRPWGNFHGGRNDPKLVKLFNNSSYRGAYMTDLIKDHEEIDSRKISEADARVIDESVRLFKEEMALLGADRTTLFILFGSETERYFSERLSDQFPNTVTCWHFAFRHCSLLRWLDENIGRLSVHANQLQSKYETKPFSWRNGRVAA